MRTNRIAAIVVGVVALSAFAVAAVIYPRLVTQDRPVTTQAMALAPEMVRAGSPVLGPERAAVTITEFFDPSCEACRAFYPIVKDIMGRHTGQVRVVLRYAAFHEGSDQIVGILEAARRQTKFVAVLEALFARQPEWAVHGSPLIDKAWEIAATAGLDVVAAKADSQRPEVAALLAQDMSDAAALSVRQTPTFFVNGKPLASFGPDQLDAFVRDEIAAAATRPKDR